MTQATIRLTVYRRDRHLLVTPWVLSPAGFKALHDLIFVEPGPGGLLHALEEGERRARAASALPLERRGSVAPPHWKQAGCSSFADFVEGSTSVAIVRNDELTEIGYRVPSTDGDSFVPREGVEDLVLGPDTSMTEVAHQTLQLFDTDE